MNEENSNSKPANTKLKLFCTHNCYEAETVKSALIQIPEYIQWFEYKDFVYEMPSVECITSTPVEETYKNWRGKTRTRMNYGKYPYTISLSFSKVLSDEELKFWRIWKLGYLGRNFSY